MRKKDMVIYVHQPAGFAFTLLLWGGTTVFLQSSSPQQRRTMLAAHLKDAKGAGRKPCKDKLLIHPDERRRQCFVQTLIISVETCCSPSLRHQLPCFSHPRPPKISADFFLHIMSKMPASTTVEIGVMTCYALVACICSRLAKQWCY